MDSKADIVYMGLQEYMLPCYTKQVLGFDCPGCGLQRSLIMLLHGNIPGAFEMYPAIFTLIPLALFLALNKFFNIKYANQFIMVLSIASVALILINYIFKLLYQT